jgi:hypothetical protein
MDLLIDWGDAVIRRGVKEPDGSIGWPKAGGASTLRQVFEANHDPASWGGLAATPWYLSWRHSK